MAIKHVDGDFFGPEHADAHRSFGFKDSASPGQRIHGGTPPFAGNEPTKGPGHMPTNYAEGGKVRGGSPPFAGDEPTRGPKHVPEPMEQGGGDYAHGGDVHPHRGHIVREEPHAASGGSICEYSHGGHSIRHPDGHMTHHHHDGSPVKAAMGGEMDGPMHIHPHGHHIVEVEHHADGRVIHVHDHGGHSVHHRDGRVTHHMADASPAMAMGGMEHMHDSSEYAHRARGGSMESEKGLIRKAIRQHDEHEHGGAHEDIELARGGRSQSLPRGMKPAGMRHHSEIGSEMPINRPPRNPQNTTTPRNAMPGGVMGYGVEPGSEPDQAGSEQGIPTMRRGGHARRD